MDTQPPWATELRARNRKVARNIWSTSDLPDRRSFVLDYERGHGENNAGERKVVDPVSFPTGSSKTANRGQSTIETERPAPIRDSSVQEARNSMKNCYPNSGDESILEYGPGIVRKLRSKYQSLALRNLSQRPSLRRSTSLENGLDLETASTTTGTPEPRNESPSPVLTTDSDSKAYRGTMTLNIRAPPVGVAIQRGRAADIINRQNRMRRARSVDALHHGEYTRHEEEILEKFKTVVLPKEEVVIIEVSKPRINPGSIYPNQQAAHDNNSPTPYARSSNVGVSDIHGADSPRRRSLTSPEHELPPHDIVRDTAKIFETNSGNLWRRVGLALRLNKSDSSDSLCQSPISPSPTPIVERNHKLPDPEPPVSNYNSSNHKEEHYPKIMSSNKTNNLHNTALYFPSNHGSPTANKQVGIIRPTMNGATTSSKDIQPVKVPAPISVAPVVRPAPLPRNTASVPAINKSIQCVNYSKPPLSPKPVFTTSAAKQSEKISEKINKATGEPAPSSPVPVAAPVIIRPGIVRQKSPEPSLPMESRNRSRSPSPMVTSFRSFPTDTGNLPKPAIHSPSSKSQTACADLSSKVELVPKHFNVMLKPVAKVDESVQQQGDTILAPKPSVVPPNNTVPFSSINQVKRDPIATINTASSPGKPVVTTTPSQVRSQVVKEGDVLKNKKAQNDADKLAEKQEQPVSQLRTHQKQKSSQQSNGSGGTMVFNFTSRNKVPDYIEDDGLHRTNSYGAGGSDDAVDSSELDRIDPKLINFIGANVIINGKSSLQKKPKSQKRSIKFNVEAITTFEYPPEFSAPSEEESNNCAINNNLLGQKGPNNVIGSGGGLGSYTPSKVTSSLYQLGTYRENAVDVNTGKLPSSDIQKNAKGDGDIIEDYLKPDTESTTWSNEIGAADILF